MYVYLCIYSMSMALSKHSTYDVLGPSLLNTSENWGDENLMSPLLCLYALLTCVVIWPWAVEAIKRPENKSKPYIRDQTQSSKCVHIRWAQHLMIKKWHLYGHWGVNIWVFKVQADTQRIQSSPLFITLSEINFLYSVYLTVKTCNWLTSCHSSVAHPQSGETVGSHLLTLTFWSSEYHIKSELRSTDKATILPLRTSIWLLLVTF